MKGALLAFFLGLNFSLIGLSEEAWVKRIYAHQVVQDDFSALQDLKKALAEWPDSRPLWQVYIKILSLRGDENGVNLAFSRYVEKFEDPYKDRDLLESMAWGVIEKGAHSSYPNVRLIAMLGAFFSQDAKGVEHLMKCLSDQNALIREAAVKLVSHLRDHKLKVEVLNRFRIETNWNVRLELIRALGAMHLTDTRGNLVSILTSKRSTSEEKAAAIQSIVELMDTADRADIETLVKSDRVGLRLLACQIVEHFDLERDLDLIVPLLNDYHADVRAAAIHVIANFRVIEPNAGVKLPSFAAPSVLARIEPLLSDPNQNVALTAAWAMTLFDPEKGQKAFQKFLEHSSLETCRLASACLAATGKYGVDLMKKTFENAKDPFVRLNLSLGLVSQRVEVDRACRVLYEGIADNSLRLRWQEYPFFRALLPAKGSSHSPLLQNPEEMNQLVRLEILNTLSLLKDPRAFEAMKNYLKKRQWGITSFASTVLLKEGDDSAISLVQEAMNDPDPQVSFQAALIVALWGRDESAIEVLQKAYGGASRENKERILEGLGRIGATTSIPFLTSKLQESAQPLRLIAAATLLQCLYH